MKIRRTLTAAEVTELHTDLERRLDAIGIPSQPEVVLKLLSLSSNRDAQLNDFAKVIKTDPAISGRVLKLSNSAIFGQRKPVSSLERACVVLGLERLKAVSLGFQLSRAAAKAKNQALSRQVWGQSVMRGCIAAEAARHLAPSLEAEAFVIGLMLDAGVPLMPMLVGDSYEAHYAQATSPRMLFNLEYENLPFTHVDVMAAMAKKWKFPDLLAKPLERHHTRPPEPPRDEPVARLHRIAFVAGTIQLSATEPPTAPEVDGPVSLRSLAGLLNASTDEAKEIVARCVMEYDAAFSIFSEIASGLGDPAVLVERVQAGLVRVLDSSIEAELLKEAELAPRRLTLAGQSVELLPQEDGTTAACLFDGHGRPLLRHRFPHEPVDARLVCETLGIQNPSADELAALDLALRRAA